MLNPEHLNHCRPTLPRRCVLSPFEIKNDLAAVATKTARAAQAAYLNAGRGNPNWIATEPRSAFFLLGQFAITESRRTMDLPGGVGGMPQAPGCAARLAAWLTAHADLPGAAFLQHVIPWTIQKFAFNPDAFVHELVDSIIGDNYPVPDRMLVHNERIVREYLQWAMCGEPRPAGTFDLYAVEGGTAAMCYLFKSLKANRLLNPGDTIALVTPIFTPSRDAAPRRLRPQDGLRPGRQEQRWQFSEGPGAAARPGGQGVLRRQSRQNPHAVALGRATIAAIGRPPRPTARPDAAHRRGGTGRSSRDFARCSASSQQKHDRRLLVQQVLRLHRLAPGRDRLA